MHFSTCTCRVSNFTAIHSGLSRQIILQVILQNCRIRAESLYIPIPILPSYRIRILLSSYTVEGGHHDNGSEYHPCGSANSSDDAAVSLYYYTVYVYDLLMHHVQHYVLCREVPHMHA